MGGKNVRADDRGTRVFVSLGSNIEPARNIERALERLKARCGLAGLSTFYETKPIGRPEQPDYLNGVAAVRTGLDALELRNGVLRVIESELGRVRGADRYAACEIDLDILLFGDAVVHEPGLDVPNPDLPARPFLAAALLELEPGVCLPDTGRPLADYVSGLERAALRPAVEFTQRLRERFLKS